MADRDYVLCDKCGQKIFYDGNDNVRDVLEEKYGEDYILYCPACLVKSLKKYDSLHNAVNKQMIKLKTLSLGIIDEDENPFDAIGNIMEALYEENNK